MAKEIQASYWTGNTLYALLLDNSGQIYNGTTFETIADANWATYDIAMSEEGTASGIYTCNMPGVDAGIYNIIIRSQEGGSPAVSDPCVGEGQLHWDGSDEVSIGSIVVDVWGYATRTLTMTAAEVAEAISGSTLTIRRGDTYELSLTDLGSIASWDKLWFTIKTKRSDQDSKALILIEEDDAVGLIYSNGAAVLDANKGNGDIAVDDEDDGDISIVIDEIETKKLAPQNNIYYDVQWRSAGGDVHTLTYGTCHIVADVTRRIDES